MFLSGARRLHDDAATTLTLHNAATGADVLVVGTAHVSRASAAQVRDAVRDLRPATVLVELCPARKARLMTPRAKRPSAFAELLALLPHGLAATLLGLTMRGAYALWRHAGLEPGAEFVAAIEEADAVGAAVVCGDRNGTETLRRLAASLSLADVSRAMSAPPAPPELAEIFRLPAEEAMERLKNREMVRTMVAYSRRLHPAAVAALLDERDEVLCAALRRCAGPRVVAVVGLAHLDGIERRWRAGEAAGPS